ncbi:LytTR family DNA-binding domain-containing protein [Yoonia sp.]|uniref:LytTR family DNA-binding domain-containing protein n=1 Tax=Yoonia sp. TaxID=2212373 RepID=UPI0025DAE348|nr:LytTR family DNA-binding domain-containing protein [Yoonia sp.]
MNRFILSAVSSFFARPIWVFLLGVSVILALIGPFGTFETMPLDVRLVYWAAMMVSAHIFVSLSQLIVDRLFAQASPLRWQMLMVAVFTVMFAPVVWLQNGLFTDEYRSIAGFFFVAVNVLGVTAAIGFLTYFMVGDDAGGRGRLYARLPQETAGSIVRLTVNDHYVEVHMDDGVRHRILMRLADAVSEMDATPGFYTHRSHWVAAAHVVGAVREDNRDYLLLHGGAKVPVTKTYREHVEAAGFL